MPSENHYMDRVAYFTKKDPSHLIQRDNAWGQHDEFSFMPKYGADLHYRCCACNALHDSDFLDQMVCVLCGWRIPNKEVARDIYIESHNVSVNFGGWTPEVLEVASRSLLPVTISKSLNMRPVGQTARNMTAWHIECLSANVRQAAHKNQVISQLRQSNPLSQLGGPL